MFSRKSVPKILRLLVGGVAVAGGVVMLTSGSTLAGGALVLVGLALVLPTTWFGGGSEFADVSGGGDGR